MGTYFAPAERTDRRSLKGQVKSISSSPVMNAVLQAAYGVLVVINENRQIVSFNNIFLKTLGVSDPEKVLGLRLGEALHCKYAFDKPNGCGTTRYCSSCGAAIAMMAAIDDDNVCERICALKVENNGHINEICLSVRAQPFIVNRNRWILIYAQDISQQQFWVHMEDVFFHDINNMLCSVCKEVAMQESLSHYKDKQNIVNLCTTRLHFIKEQAINAVLNKNLSDGTTILEEGASEDISIFTDPMLVSRILINMLINALEATNDGGIVKFRTIVDKSQVSWEVWNSASIPENIQLRIFQKFFSTKPDNGHGLGTYSMKFFGEECLGGKVSFTSANGEGTTFRLSLDLK